ncbi:MAG: hypothetical protein LBG12_11100 [Synergistaceae bacterium]|nr:hypothetical protein [Synergistaceae bacterium]
MADIITFDTAYFQELTKDLGDISKSLDEAKASLRKATVGLDSGLVAFALCVKLNEDIKQIKNTADARISETDGFSKALADGIANVNRWEENTKNRESGLALQIGKTWGFEDGNFTGEAGSSGSTVPDNGARDPGTTPGIDIDWTYFMSILFGLGGLTRAAIENAIKQAITGGAAGAVVGGVTTGGPGVIPGAVSGAATGALKGTAETIYDAQGVEESATEGIKVRRALDRLEDAGYNVLDLLNPIGKGQAAREYLTEALNAP